MALVYKPSWMPSKYQKRIMFARYAEADIRFTCCNRTLFLIWSLKWCEQRLHSNSTTWYPTCPQRNKRATKKCHTWTFWKRRKASHYQRRASKATCPLQFNNKMIDMKIILSCHFWPWLFRRLYIMDWLMCLFSCPNERDKCEHRKFCSPF